MSHTTLKRGLQWETRELGTVWKSLLHIVTLLLMTIFWSALDSSHHSPTPSQQCCGQKKHSFPPMVFKINFVWGGRGGVTSFTNITGNVLTLLTSIVPIRGWPAIALRYHHTATLTHNNLLLHGFYSQDRSSVPPRFHYWIDYLKSEPLFIAWTSIKFKSAFLHVQWAVNFSW